MRQALWILRKDIRHLWPRAAVFVALEAVGGLIDASAPRRPQLAVAGFFGGLLLSLAAAFVVVSVIHEERLVGDRQFWVTRPYSRKSLLLAKAFFLLLFVNLPVLLGQIAALLASGLSPLGCLPQLLARQSSLTFGLLVGGAALAVVTADFVQVVLLVLGSYTALYLFVVIRTRLDTTQFDPGSAKPVLDAWQMFVGLLFAAGATVAQSARRGVWLPRCLAVGALASSSFVSLFPWGPAFALVASGSPSVGSSVARVTPDFERKTERPGAFYLEVGTLPVLFPIRLTGIPDGMEVYSERANVSLEAPGGEIWRSGWNSNNFVTDRSLAYVPLKRLLPGAGDPYWLQANVSTSFYESHSQELVRLHATVAFTMLGKGRVTPMAAWNSPQSIGDGGFCSLNRDGKSAPLFCFAPFPGPSLSLVRYQKLVNGNLAGMPGSNSAENGFSIWALLSGGVGYPAPPEPSDVSIETRKAVAHFERTLDMANVRMGDFARKQ